MLACDKTVTAVRYEGEGYRCTVIHGVSWFEKSQVRIQEKGLVSASSFSVRIPASCLPEGFQPKPGDVLLLGTVTAPILRPVDLAVYRHFTATAVGDNRRKPSHRPHVVVRGE